MARPFKIFLLVLAVIVLLVVGAIFTAAALFDPNDYRDQITKAAKDETGRDLKLGNIDLSLFPWLKVQVDDVSLSNAAGFVLCRRSMLTGTRFMPMSRSRR